MTYKIAFVGKAGSGKTTLAEYLVKKHGFRKFSFADAVKEIAYKYFGMVKKDRDLLQAIGEKLREIDKDVWIKILLAKLDVADYVHAVVDDCRYLNEAKALRDRGFILIKLGGSHKTLTLQQRKHSSEREVDQIVENYFLDTNKPLEETYQELEEILKNTGGRWKIVGD